MKLALLSLLLAGCASFDAPVPKEIVHSQFHFTIYERPELLPAPNVHGTATLLDFGGQRVCVVNLRQYPVCLLHEIRHCIEGNWHDEKPNSEDC
jgi:hypothetical protein